MGRPSRCVYQGVEGTRALTGDATATATTPDRRALLAQWSRRYREPLLSFFRRRMSVAADCEDLVQEVFLRLSRREDLGDIERIDSYLFQTASTVVIDWRRRQTTRHASAHDELDEDLLSVDCSPERVLLGRDAVRAMIEALGTLPPKTRAVFMLYHFEGMPHTEIGRRLGMAVRTVEDHVARANARLAPIVAERR